MTGKEMGKDIQATIPKIKIQSQSVPPKDRQKNSSFFFFFNLMTRDKQNCILNYDMNKRIIYVMHKRSIKENDTTLENYTLILNLRKVHKYLHQQETYHGIVWLFSDLLLKKIKQQASQYQLLISLETSRPTIFHSPVSISSINASTYSTVSSLNISRKMLTNTRT